jgi:hypothetical protein
MSSAALAINCRSLEKDPSPVESVRVDCPGCDPDNPRSVPRSQCRRCRGTGKIPTAAGAIASEIHAARLQLLLGKTDRDQDLDE